MATGVVISMARGVARSMQCVQRDMVVLQRSAGSLQLYADPDHRSSSVLSCRPNSRSSVRQELLIKAARVSLVREKLLRMVPEKNSTVQAVTNADNDCSGHIIHYVHVFREKRRQLVLTV